MSLTVTLILDDETGDYLERFAADQGRTPAEVAAWIVTEDLQRERIIDAELLARLDPAAAESRERPAGPRSSLVNAGREERAGA